MNATFSLLPLMTFSYFLQFLDKSSLNYSSSLGLLTDTVCAKGMHDA